MGNAVVVDMALAVSHLQANPELGSMIRDALGLERWRPLDEQARQINPVLLCAKDFPPVTAEWCRLGFWSDPVTGMEIDFEPTHYCSVPDGWVEL